MDTIRIPVIKVQQNIGAFYVGVMNARDLYLMAHVDQMRLEKLDVPKYEGIQRALNKSKVKLIKGYLAEPNSTFPNAIVVSLDPNFINNWDELDLAAETTELEIIKVKKAIEIIDGQHRVAGFEGIGKDFQVVVSFFVDVESSVKAEIFFRINHTQTPVNRSIAFQLFGYSESRSPQRTAHDMAVALNTSPASPFYQKLLMMGVRDAWSRRGLLSQATFCKGIMELYSKKPEDDQNRLYRGQKLESYPGYPLRQWFIEEKDGEILDLVWAFFELIAKTWPKQWYDQTGRFVLRKTTGYNALVKIMRRWLSRHSLERDLQKTGLPDSLGSVRHLYEEPDKQFVRENYPAGNQGVIKLRNALFKDLGLE